MSNEYAGILGDENQRKAPCPECGKETRVDTLFQRIDRWHDNTSDLSGVVENYVLSCRGCETVFHCKATGDSEDYYDYYDHDTGEPGREYLDQRLFWPSQPAVPTPSWAGLDLEKADKTLHELFASIYKATNFEMPVLAAIGMRTAFDRVSELMGIDTSKSFADKIEDMRKSGFISGVQKGILEVLIDAGSAAAHRSWKPTRKQLAIMLEILEALVRDHFVLQEEVKELKKQLPPKQT